MPRCNGFTLESQLRLDVKTLDCTFYKNKKRLLSFILSNNTFPFFFSVERKLNIVKYEILKREKLFSVQQREYVREVFEDSS